MNKLVKILIYNWIPFDEEELKGGGVTIYLRNYINKLSQNPDYDVYFLSSGRAYNRERADIYIEETENRFKYNCKMYQIVNSPVLSPAVLSFPTVFKYLYDAELKSVVEGFLTDYQFDVIHFHNLEGLSLGVLELKEKFPDTKFIYSVHNYYAICPQVMLWEADAHNCSQANCGEHCLKCMSPDVFERKIIVNQEINYLKKQGKDISEEYLIEQKRIEKEYSGKSNLDIQSKLSLKHLISTLEDYRHINIEYINQYMDLVLAVSQRVKEIMVNAGVEESKIQVEYIGTKAAENQVGKATNDCSGEIINLCYLGFMRKMKGFYFILDALESLPDSIAKKVTFTFATHIGDIEVEQRIQRLREKLAGVRVVDGYQYDELPTILQDIHLGIVPPLWEDNLPQVAIEFKAYGVPVLCSNLGGAKELTKMNDFIFEAGNIDDFQDKLINLINNPKLLNRYWDGAEKLVTMDEHVSKMTGIYC